MLTATTFLLLIKLSLKSKFSTESSPTQVEKAKPNPEIFQLAFDKFGFGTDDVAPEEVLVLEDSPLGVRDHPHLTSTLCSPPFVQTATSLTSSSFGPRLTLNVEVICGCNINRAGLAAGMKVVMVAPWKMPEGEERPHQYMTSMFYFAPEHWGFPAFE